MTRLSVCVLGGNGRLGTHVVRELKRRDVSVRALVRRPESVEHLDGAEIVVGDACDPGDLERALSGCQAVVSCLNISRKMAIPWSPSTSPKNLLSQAMSVVCGMAGSLNIQRIVTCSAWGVAETRKQLPLWFRTIVAISQVGTVYRDHAKQEEIVRQSETDWTIVRPVFLTNQPANVPAVVTEERPTSIWVSRQAVAAFMVQELLANRFVRQAVTVS